MFMMIIVFIIMILYCHYKKHKISFFPKHLTYTYILVTVFSIAFYLLTLLFFQKFSLQKILILFYGSIVTPIFEETLFRGIIWERLNINFSKEWKTYLLVTILFALWHIGYAIGIYLWNGGNLLTCIAMKVAVGTLFGLITGAIRFKTKNCYIGIIIHGLLNVIG